VLLQACADRGRRCNDKFSQRRFKTSSFLNLLVNVISSELPDRPPLLLLALHPNVASARPSAIDIDTILRIALQAMPLNIQIFPQIAK
jgi:hypothetical protein